MELEDKEKQFVKDECRKKELSNQIKEIADAMWVKVGTLKKGTDKLKWQKIQEKKAEYRQVIQPLKNELNSL